MAVIKNNANLEGLFIAPGNMRTRKRIQDCLSKGDIYSLRHWGFDNVLECAAAVKLFIQDLPEPIIPLRVQELVTADNAGVDAATVASDAVGLLSQEVSGRHLELLLAVLGFLHDSATSNRSTELTGCSLPLKLLPVFFCLKEYDTQLFRQIATVFNEIIFEAPKKLAVKVRASGADGSRIVEEMLAEQLETTPMDRRGGENEGGMLPNVQHSRLHPLLD